MNKNFVIFAAALVSVAAHAIRPTAVNADYQPTFKSRDVTVERPLVVAGMTKDGACRVTVELTPLQEPTDEAHNLTGRVIKSTCGNGKGWVAATSTRLPGAEGGADRVLEKHMLVVLFDDK